MSSPTHTPSDPIDGELVDTTPAAVSAPWEWVQPAPAPIQVTHYHYYLGGVERVYREAEPASEAAEAVFGYRPGEYLIDNTSSSQRTLVAFLFLAVLLLGAAVVLL